MLLVLAAATALDPWPGNPLRVAWFDTCQQLAPREVSAHPVVVVAIDEASLERYGQWPWPRNLIADLVGRILDQQPAALGIDLLFPEPDRLSPARWAGTRPDLDADTRARLSRLEDNDLRLARRLEGGPVVLAVAGSDEGTAGAGRFPPVREVGGLDRSALSTWSGAVRSLPLLDDAARGHGVISFRPGADGVVRHLPLVVRIGERLAPSLTLEMLRLAAGAPVFEVVAERGAVQGVQVGDLPVPTDAEGRLRVWFSPSRPERFVSAADVMDGTVDPRTFTRRFAILGVTGLGVVDLPATPVAPRMPGPEVHAQVLENVFERRYLRRPTWAPWAEAGLLLAAGLVLVALAPRTRTVWLPALAGASLAGFAGAGWGAYQWGPWLVDAATPGVAFALLFVLVLTIALSTADHERRRLDAALALERDRAQRAAGELEAARRIQMGILPRVEAELGADPRFDLAVDLEPARAVGGDLYDFFMLDRQRLFFVVGDVAGKGVPASLFMAITKALWKSTALRMDTDVEGIMNTTNREVSRDNPEMLFVTALSGVLDLEDGRLRYAVAGHDAPLRFLPGASPRRLEGEGGPPLGVLDDFEFPLAEARLGPGETLCLYTDGVTEASDAAGELYGAKRLAAALERASAAGLDPAGVLDVVRRDVAAFVADAPQADDLTLLVLRWNGA